MRRVAMLVMVGLLAACGSDGDSGSSDEDDPSEKSSTTTEEKAERDLEGDQELADGAVLTIDDVPTGFAEKPEDDDEEDDAIDQSLAECLGITVAELNDGDAEPGESTTFGTEGGQEVSSEVVMYATEEEVTEDLELLKDPASQDCFAEALNQIFAADGEVEIGEITIEDLGVEDLGEDAVGFGVAIPFAAESGERVLYLDLVAVQQGRAEISMAYQGFDVPFDVGLAYDLAATVVDRVPADA